MIIGMTGATGFVGQHIEKAAAGKDRVLRFSRHPQFQERLFSTTSTLDVSGCEGLVHLAGESILGLWTRKKRQQILESRIEGTRRLVEGIAAAPIKPRVLISASAIGYYGTRGDAFLDESSSEGTGFLSEVAQLWEAEAMKATSLGVRVVCLRIGLVLGRDGGLLKRAAPFFHAGLGARLGTGKQWMSCIHVTDLANLIIYSLHHEKIQGVINAVMPTPLTNNDFTQTMAHAVRRPTFFSLPAFLLKNLLGDASHLLLDSQRVLPTKTLSSGFYFQYPTVEEALQREMKRPSGLDL